MMFSDKYCGSSTSSSTSIARSQTCAATTRPSSSSMANTVSTVAILQNPPIASTHTIVYTIAMWQMTSLMMFNPSYNHSPSPSPAALDLAPLTQTKP